MKLVRRFKNFLFTDGQYRLIVNIFRNLKSHVRQAHNFLILLTCMGDEVPGVTIFRNTSSDSLTSSFKTSKLTMLFSGNQIFEAKLIYLLIMLFVYLFISCFLQVQVIWHFPAFDCDTVWMKNEWMNRELSPTLFNLKLEKCTVEIVPPSGLPRYLNQCFKFLNRILLFLARHSWSPVWMKNAGKNIRWKDKGHWLAETY